MGKQLGPIACKVCGGEHQGTICTKFNSVKVMAPRPAAQPVRLALPKPPASNEQIVSSTLTGRSKKSRNVKAAKSKTSPKRKAYLAEKAQERRDAKKAGMAVPVYRAHQASTAITNSDLSGKS